MANYPQLDNARGIWNMTEVYDAVMIGRWPNAAGGRAIYVGGATPSASDVIDFITMSSAGNATDFGNLTGNKNTMPGVCSNFTRGLIGDATNIDYITYASTGNAADFGDMSVARGYSAGMNSSTRGVFAGGGSPTLQNVIDYVTIATVGDATDFGNLTVARENCAGASSPTRGVICGGKNSGSSPYVTNTIDYLTIATTGNAVDFGDNTAAAVQMGGCSSSTRGTFMAGQTTPTYLNTINYVEIASTGDAVDFGDLSAAKTSGAAASNSVKGIFAGGETPSVLNVIEEFTIAVGGVVTDFGDLATARKNIGAGSNQNGGLNDGFTRAFPIPRGAGAGNRGIWSGGIDPAARNDISFKDISSLGDASDFGDLKGTRYYHSACGSSTRYIAMAGVAPADAPTNDVEYVQFATKGNGAFFSDATVENREMVGLSNETRGISGGGSSPYINVIEYITIASVGTDGLDFGDLAANTSYMGGFASTTRGVFIGGNPGSSPNKINVIQYITIGSTGNTTDFGDLTETVKNTSGASSSVRGLRMGGALQPGVTNVIDYITIASTGDATDFGDLTAARSDPGCTSNSIRAVAVGGQSPSTVNTMDYITIATTGDASDFGDLPLNVHHHEGSSNGHGGVG